MSLANNFYRIEQHIHILCTIFFDNLITELYVVLNANFRVVNFGQNKSRSNFWRWITKPNSSLQIPRGFDTDNSLKFHGMTASFLIFGIYTCHLFDTREASKALNLDRNSQRSLLLYMCGLDTSVSLILLQDI